MVRPRFTCFISVATSWSRIRTFMISQRHSRAFASRPLGAGSAPGAEASAQLDDSAGNESTMTPNGRGNAKEITMSLGAGELSPSEQQHNKSWRDQSRHAFRPRVDPRETTIILFPGQGSQFVGMGKKLLHYPNVKELYEKASAVFKYDLLHMCLNGSQSQLDKTIHCQAAIFVTSIAALEKLGEDHPEAIENCVAAAGFSVGEIAALVFAGAISFDDALQLIRVRAEAMQQCSEAVPSGLLTVFQERQTQLGLAMHAAREYCRRQQQGSGRHAPVGEAVCTIANYLSPECKVIGGHLQALDFVRHNAGEFRLHKVKQLPVSGAFHTPLMGAAMRAVAAELEKLPVVMPLLPVHGNVNGFQYKTVEAIKKLLPRQVQEPVKWEQTLHIMYEREQGTEFPTTYEVGPGRQLGAILRLVNRKAYASYRNVEV